MLLQNFDSIKSEKLLKIIKNLTNPKVKIFEILIQLNSYIP